MLNRVEKLKGYHLHGLDGEFGTVRDFYFDDQHWTIRYLVVNTVGWLPGRQVLITPHAITAVNNTARTIMVHLTKKQIEESPSLDKDKPVSRQFEESYFSYYRWPVYWGGAFAWGPFTYITRDRENLEQPAQSEKESDPRLRSAEIVAGNIIHAKDGEIGHVEDFIIDVETWAILYLVINTRNWWSGKEALISPKWIESVNWTGLNVVVNLSRDVIKRSPDFIKGSLPTREYEIKLHQYYERQGYWENLLEKKQDQAEKIKT